MSVAAPVSAAVILAVLVYVIADVAEVGVSPTQLAIGVGLLLAAYFCSRELVRRRR